MIALADVQGTRNELDALPAHDHPELFGLSMHSEMASSVEHVTQLFETLRMASAEAAGSRDTGNDFDTKIASSVCESVSNMSAELSERLPTAFLVAETRSALAKDGGPSAPVNTVLRQEIDLLREVLQRVIQTLDDVRAAINGSILMTEEIMGNVRVLYNKGVPAGES